MVSTLNETGRLHLWAPGFGAFGGGITAFSRALATALGEIAPNWRLNLYGKADSSATWGPFPLRGAGTWPAKLRTAAFGGLLAAAACRQRPSLIISCHLHFGPAARALRAVLGVPYVLVAHGIEVHTGLSRARRAALRQADGVWAVSTWTRQRLLDVGVPGDRIQLVPNTVSESGFRVGPSDRGLRSRYGLQPDEKVVLTVTRLNAREGYKGYDKVLRALPAACDAVGSVRYLVVGHGDDGDHLRELAAELHVSDRLTLCGFVPEAELAAHYRLADVFAMPSLGEGFGIVFLEAMSCGIPVLGGNQDGSVDALADGQLGRLVDPENLSDIASALIDLLQGRGPALWFDPHALRGACLSRFGRPVFRERVRDALTVATGNSR
jgi:glycosyltransferase involved in cell wall biosynthesis